MANEIFTSGPDSFAVSPLDVRAAPSAAGFTQLSAGIQGGAVAPASRAGGIDFSSQGPGTLDLLLKLGEKALTPRVALERAKQQGAGAIAAMQGITAAELAKGDLFNGIFGDPTAVAAARQVEKVTHVEDAITEVQKSMDEWKKRTPSEFKAELPKLLERHLTGDEMSDSLITHAFIQRMPQLVEAHTKASVKYQNDQAANAWFSKMKSSAATYQAIADSDTAPEAKLAAQAAMAQDIAGALSVFNEENAGKVAFSLIRQLGASGHTAALDVLVSSGLIDALKPEQQAMVPKLVDEAKTEYYKNAPAFVAANVSIGTVEASVNDGAISMNQLKEFYSQAQAKYPKLLNNVWLRRQTEILLGAQLRNSRKAEKAGPGDMISTQRQWWTFEVRRDGNLKELPPGFKESEVAAWLDEEFKNAPPVQQQALIDQSIKGQRAMPSTAQRAYLSTLNQLALGRLQLNAQPQLLELNRLLNLSRTGFIENFGAQQTTMFESAVKAGMLTPEKDDKAFAQKLTSFAALVQTDPIKREGFLKETRALARSAIPWDWPKKVMGDAVMSSRQKEDFADLVAGRAELIGKHLNVDADAAVQNATAEVLRDTDFVLGSAVRGPVGQGRPFRSLVAKEVASVSGAQLEEKLYTRAVRAALDTALNIKQRKTNRQETDYEVVGAYSKRSGEIELRVMFDGIAVPVPVTLRSSDVSSLYKHTTAASAAEDIEKARADMEGVFTLAP